MRSIYRLNFTNDIDRQWNIKTLTCWQPLMRSDYLEECVFPSHPSLQLSGPCHRRLYQPDRPGSIHRLLSQSLSFTPCSLSLFFFLSLPVSCLWVGVDFLGFASFLLLERFHGMNPNASPEEKETIRERADNRFKSSTVYM